MSREESPTYTADFISYNVAHNGRHFCEIAERMGFDVPENFERELCARFPASEGFSVSRKVRPNGFHSFKLDN